MFIIKLNNEIKKRINKLFKKMKEKNKKNDSKEKKIFRIIKQIRVLFSGKQGKSRLEKILCQ